MLSVRTMPWKLWLRTVKLSDGKWQSSLQLFYTDKILNKDWPTKICPLKSTQKERAQYRTEADFLWPSKIPQIPTPELLETDIFQDMSGIQDWGRNCSNLPIISPSFPLEEASSLAHRINARQAVKGPARSPNFLHSYFLPSFQTHLRMSVSGRQKETRGGDPPNNFFQKAPFPLVPPACFYSGPQIPQITFFTNNSHQPERGWWRVSSR